MSETEVNESFDCFGSSCSVFVTGAGGTRSAGEAAALVKRSLLRWHARFSRFLPDSELTVLNEDPRREVPVSALMAYFVHAVRVAGSLTAGLVDATLLEEVQAAGYSADLEQPLPLPAALALAPARKAAKPKFPPRWQGIAADLEKHTVTRTPGIKLDSGGLAKGLFADILAGALSSHGSFAINCAGDLAIGGSERVARPVKVESPFDRRTLHTFELQRCGVATSGIGRRSWLGEDGRPAHHLLDPSSSSPAFTGLVQVTALAPSALLAEIHAKAAILSGPRRAPKWLPHGGVIVLDDGSYRVINPPPVVALSELSGYVNSAPHLAHKDM